MIVEEAVAAVRAIAEAIQDEKAAEAADFLAGEVHRLNKLLSLALSEVERLQIENNRLKGGQV